jgi:DNA repair exonuclease SbcCD ATPase subunit
MNLNEYKTQIKTLETRLAKLEKEHDRQNVIFEESMKNLAKFGIENIDEVDAKIAELEEEIEKYQNKLDAYLKAFEEKLTEIEDILK